MRMIPFLFLVLLQVAETAKRSPVDEDLWTPCSLTCGGGIQQLKAQPSIVRVCNTNLCPGDAGCKCLRYTFDIKTDEGKVYDASYTRNMGELEGGATITDDGHKGACLDLTHGGNVTLDAEHFHNRPGPFLTIATWVKLCELHGTRTIFHTIGNTQGFNQGEYILEIMDGFVRWVHIDANGSVVFLVASKTQIKCGHWVHIALTYKALTGEAEIYIDGMHDLTIESENLKDTLLRSIAMDWSKAAIGVYNGGVDTLGGKLDEFHIFKCAVSDTDVEELYQKDTIKRFEIPVFG